MSKELRVRIMNYQRIRKADLTFVPGLNIIEGKSNSGKSALGRALETAIYNVPRESHVTLGQTQSAVAITYNDHEIVWRRDKTKPSQVSYRIDGQVYNKLGRGQSEDVARCLGISEVEVNGKKFRINFGKQMAYPFILDSTPSEFFKFIVQSGEEDSVTDVLDSMKKDCQDMKKDINTLTATVDTLAQEYQREAKAYEALKPAVLASKKILDLEPSVKAYESLVEDADVYTKASTSVKELKHDIDDTKAQYTFLASQLDRLAMQRAQLEDLSSTVSLWSQSMEVISNSVDEKDSYESFIKNTEQIDSLKNTLYKVSEKRAKIDGINRILSEEKRYKEILSTSKEDLDSARTQIQNMDESYDYITSAQIKLEDCKVSKKSIHEDSLQHFRLSKEIEDNKERIIATERIITEINQELSTFDTCPLCGSPIKDGVYHKEED